MLLAIDTSSGTSAALFEHGKLVSKVVFDDPFGHAENIGEAIARALNAAGSSTKDLTQVVIGRGPAPYTGLRVGMAAGITLARALGIQLLGAMVLDAIAFGRTGNLVVTTDAKRGELFFARFEHGKRIEGPAVIHPEELKIPEGYNLVAQSCDAEMVGRFALAALANGEDLTEVSAIYLRSADVTPSKGKKVSG